MLKDCWGRAGFAAKLAAASSSGRLDLGDRRDLDEEFDARRILGDNLLADPAEGAGRSPGSDGFEAWRWSDNAAASSNFLWPSGDGGSGGSSWPSPADGKTSAW